MISSSLITCLINIQKIKRCIKLEKKNLIKIDFIKINKKKIMNELCDIHKNYFDRQV